MSPKVKEVFPGVWQIDNIIDPAIGKLIAFFAKNQAEKAKHGPNSMNKYGAILTGTLRDICRHIAFPVMEKRIFNGIKLKIKPYVMTVSYDVKKQRSLAAHVDSSEFTFNGCLAGKFSGGDLVVYSTDDKTRKVLKQKPGRAFVHRGDVKHRAMPLRSGTRTNVVLWCTAKKI